jgi:hypothetical protein
MKAIKTILGLFFACLIFESCNPNCTSSGLSGLALSTDIGTSGFEFTVKANPLSNLRDRKVYIGDKLAETRFDDAMGLIVKIPDGTLIGDSEVRIENPECADYIPLKMSIKEKDVFKNQFVFPIVPQIVIPSVPSVFPPSIDNAWLGADNNTDYCLWFDTMDTLFKSDGKTIDKITKRSSIDEKSSFEQSTCGKTNVPYSRNPVFGVYDEGLKLLHFWIDRRGKNLGIEEFRGQFIDMSKSGYPVPDKYDLCNGAAQGGKTGHMLLITSMKTGRQLVIFQKK